jgi:Protein of unknown function (DUF3667)
MPTCNNCNRSFEGRYCNQCGQKATAGRLSLHEIFHELVHAFTHADKGILRLVKELFIAPGNMYRNYFSGKRKSYFSPVMFFLLAMGLLILVGSKLLDMEHTITGRDNHFDRTMYSYQKIRYLFFIPIISLITLAFFRKRYNLAECLAFWFLCTGFICVADLLIYIPRFLFIKQQQAINYWGDWLIWLLIVLHLYIVFFHKTVWSAIGCFILGVLSYLLLVYIYGLLAYSKGYYYIDLNPWHIIKHVFS